MVKTGRWLKSLLSGKKSASGSPEGKQGKEKKRWGFVRSRHDRGNAEKECGFHKENSASLGAVTTGEVASMDPEKRAIAVAAATAAVAEAAAAVAEAAAAAAHAAEAVVRLTSSGRCVLAGWKRESLAAIRIQTDFRGYLARRALRALKGLVRLQALVRGRIVRKQIAENLRLMQALVRAQARARAHRVLCTEPGLLRTKPAKASLGPRTPEKHEPSVRIYKIKPDRAPSPIKRDAVKPNYVEAEVDRNNSGRLWFDRWIDGRGGVIVPTNATDDENAKVLEIDPGKPPFMSKRKSSLRSSQSVFSTSDCNSGSHSFTMIPGSPSKDSTIAQLSSPSPSSVDMPALRLNPLRLPHEDHESTFATSENSQQFYSASSRPGAGKHGPFTPLKSEYAQSLFGGYGHYPNYMANTESWRAKARSQSAPKQRPDLDKSGSAKRIPAYGLFEQRSSSTNMHSQRSSLHTKFISKAYPGSGRLDRLGMPVS